ncbi:MAG: toll/interleukin-1 receptor domain-containing protein [Oscillospiraceae bacterium]|nr:toll/interleukin-1 receptor domain-containing protein [Oscillospiraceae bacterium]
MGANKYDVFISFKHSDAENNKTKDSAIAENLYHFLREHGVRVFFSPFELEFLGQSQYSKVIDEALDASRFLVVIGCSRENLDSQWVRYEWDSFLNDIRSSAKADAEVFVIYADMAVSDLPRALRQRQAFPADENDSFERLYNFLKNAGLQSMPQTTEGIGEVAGVEEAVKQTKLEHDDKAGRQTFTLSNPARFITFNSITDSKWGDERNFVLTKEIAEPADQWRNLVKVTRGGDYFIRIYVHNNAAENLNLIAEDVRVMTRIAPHEGYVTRVQIDSIIGASNATPKEVWNHVVFTSDSTPFKVEFLPGTARFYNNNSLPDGWALNEKALFQTAQGEGALLGYSSLDGKIPGCYQFDGHILYQVRVKVKNIIPDDRSSLDSILSASELGAKGWEHYRKRDFVTANKCFDLAIEKGYTDAHAMILVAHAYRDGKKGVERDYDKAFSLYQKAVEGGATGNWAGWAEYNLGVFYQYGRTVPVNMQIAAEWYMKSANKNCVGGMARIGLFYEEGLGGLPMDAKMAAYWYLKATQSQDKSGSFAKHNAQYRLGLLYRDGRGVEKDAKKAAEWLKKAADGGDQDAKNELEIINLLS